MECEVFYFKVLAVNPGLLKLLIWLFDKSQFLSRIVIRRPEWIEEIVRGGNLDLALDKAGYLSCLKGFEASKSEPERLRL